MYWSNEGRWPFAMVHEQSSARSAEDPIAAATAAAATAVPAVSAAADASSLHAHESDLLHVRLLQFESSPTSFAAKIAAADIIEGFSPSRPDSHEYVRRKVWVDVEEEPVPAAAAAAAGAGPSLEQQQHRQQPRQRVRIPAWIYIKEHGLTSEVLAGHERMEHGDWMKRDRKRNK